MAGKFKMILDVNGPYGVRIDKTECYEYELTFKFMFNYDCKTLYETYLQKIETGEITSLLQIFEELKAEFVMDRFRGDERRPTQVYGEFIYGFDINNKPTGITFRDDICSDKNCVSIYNQIYEELGENCNIINTKTFESIWLEYKLTFKPEDIDLIKDDRINIGVQFSGVLSNFNFLMDDICLDIYRLPTDNEIQFETRQKVNFELDRVVDNHKSWVDDINEDKYREKLGEYRNTIYKLEDDRAVLNSKELDFEISASSLIEKDMVEWLCCLNSTDPDTLMARYGFINEDICYDVLDNDLSTDFEAIYRKNCMEIGITESTTELDIDLASENNISYIFNIDEEISGDEDIKTIDINLNGIGELDLPTGYTQSDIEYSYRDIRDNFSICLYHNVVEGSNPIIRFKNGSDGRFIGRLSEGTYFSVSYNPINSRWVINPYSNCYDKIRCCENVKFLSDLPEGFDVDKRRNFFKK